MGSEFYLYPLQPFVKCLAGNRDTSYSEFTFYLLIKKIEIKVLDKIDRLFFSRLNRVE